MEILLITNTYLSSVPFGGEVIKTNNANPSPWKRKQDQSELGGEERVPPYSEPGLALVTRASLKSHRVDQQLTCFVFRLIWTRTARRSSALARFMYRVRLWANKTVVVSSVPWRERLLIGFEFLFQNSPTELLSTCVFGTVISLWSYHSPKTAFGRNLDMEQGKFDFQNKSRKRKLE